MEAKELVGKCIEAYRVAGALSMPVDTALRVVGYNASMNWAIVDAGLGGWKSLSWDDIVIEKCKTYMYASPDYIARVL